MNTTTTSVRELRIGQELEHDIFDTNGVLLLKRGTAVTERFVAALRARGIQEVTHQQTDDAPLVDASDMPREAGPARSDLFDLTVGPPSKSAQASASAPATPVKKNVIPCDPEAWSHLDASAHEEATAYLLGGRPRPPIARLDPDVFDDAVAQAEAQVGEAIAQWSRVGAALAEGRLDHAEPAVAVVERLLPTLAADIDLASVMMRLQDACGATIFRHGVRTAVMAMHLARQVGYAPDRVIDAGLVALTQDVGMLRVPDTIRDAPRKPTAAEWDVIRRHPGHASNLLEGVTGLRPDITIAVYQHHERLDGSGYPQGRKGMFLHPLAKLVAVADTYAAVTDARPYRAARSAHQAVRAVAQGIKARRLDADAGRVLIESVSLYPVGTRVVLSDGQHAEVTRTHDGRPDRPVVMLLDTDGNPTRKVRDLAFDENLKIVSEVEPTNGACAA